MLMKILHPVEVDMLWSLAFICTESNTLDIFDLDQKLQKYWDNWYHSHNCRAGFQNIHDQVFGNEIVQHLIFQSSPEPRIWS